MSSQLLSSVESTIVENPSEIGNSAAKSRKQLRLERRTHRKIERAIAAQNRKDTDDTFAIVSMVSGAASLFFGLLGLAFFPFTFLALAAAIAGLIFAKKAKAAGQDETLRKIGLYASIAGIVGSIIYMGIFVLYVVLVIF